MTESVDPMRVGVGEYQRRWRQKEINDWGQKIFRQMEVHPLVVFKKFFGEVSEHYDALVAYTGVGQPEVPAEDVPRIVEERWEKLKSEFADLQVLLYQMAGSCGVNLDAVTDEKMDKNERRKWNVSPDGVGQHVEGT